MTLDNVKELYRFLRGTGPKGFILPGRPKLGHNAAFAVIYVLQERFHLIADTIEQCDECQELFDSAETGSYDENTGRHYCTSCEAHMPAVETPAAPLMVCAGCSKSHPGFDADDPSSPKWQRDRAGKWWCNTCTAG